ncbi:MAG: putative porin [Elusimicrobiota bacterium]
MRRWLRLSIPTIGLALATGAQAQVLSFRDTVRSVKLNGDLRLRHDAINYQTSPAYTAADTKGTAEKRARQHSRFRLRIGADIGLPYDMTTSLGLASGKGEQTSTNQSFEGMGTAKGIWIDYAYLRWAPKFSDDASASFAAGKVKSPFWRVASSDLVFDGDINPEGLSQSVEGFAPLGVSLFGNALQWNVNENGSSAQSSVWMFGQQAGAEVRLPLQSRMRVAGTWYKWTKERLRSTASTNPTTKTADGNRRGSDGMLWNEFNVAEVTGELSGWVSKVPLRLQGTYINNMAARHDLDRWGRQHEGWQVGGIIGEAKLAGSWEAAFFQKWLEADATLADVTDSDFGEGGTNRRGQIFWLAYCPLDWMEFRTKFFHTRTIDESLKPWRNDINRFQADMTIKF